jgi:hypothetical protein
MGMQSNMIVRLIDQADVDVTVPLYPLTPEHICEQILGFVSGVCQTLLASIEHRRLHESRAGGIDLDLNGHARFFAAFERLV